MFVRGSNDIFSQAAILTRSDGAAESFGRSATIRGDTVVVGARTVNGTPGGAYVFVKPPGGWSDGSVSTVVPTGVAPGQHGALDNGIFEHAVYKGRESLPGLNKCYWSTVPRSG